MNAALRVLMLGIVCAGATALALAIISTLITLISPCYWTDQCQKTPIIGWIGFILDTLGYIAYFSLFPLGTLVFKKIFRKLFSRRRHVKMARWAFALIPVFFFPLKYLLNINLI